MKTNIQKTDEVIKADVLAELKFDPHVKVTDIGVLVTGGTVTLNGYATSYGEKWEAVKATKRVAGVNAIADDMEVRPPNSSRQTDGDIAHAALKLIDASPSVQAGTVHVTVSEGWVTLEGEVEWWHQRDSAKNAIRHLPGLKGVSNLISIKSIVTSEEVEKDIRAAFERNALLDSSKIKVETSGHHVVLHGRVRNYAEREEAERVAGCALGVTSVDNQLAVRWFGLAN
ncbi:MAG: BON domain-containing protein [Verrucomicrobiae bacterium]